MTQFFELDKSHKLQIRVPNNWSAFNDLYGVPLMLLGPERPPNKRDAISFVASKAENLRFEDAQLKSKEAEYQNGRQLWITKRSASLIKYFPFETLTSKTSGITFRKIGYQYVLGEERFEEYEYLFECKEHLVFVKTLHSLDTASTGEVEDLIEKIKCI